MQDQAHATETISIVKEPALNTGEALNYITGQMRQHIGSAKYITWKAEVLEVGWFYVRIAQVNGQAAHELHIPTRLYIEGGYDLLDAELAGLVEKFLEEVQNAE